jgi:hypothetical protein
LPPSHDAAKKAQKTMKDARYFEKTIPALDENANKIEYKNIIMKYPENRKNIHLPVIYPPDI